MGFMNSMKSTLNEDFNESYTENGALGYRTTGKHLLDLNFKVASLRKADAETIISGFDKAFSEDHIHVLKWLFYLRDAREGLGERRSFRIIMSHMANVEPEISKVLIGLIAEYGRYDDLLSLVGTECEKNALEVIKNQLMKDLEAKKANKPVSLLAKWMPSCNATSYKTKENATVVRKYLGFTERQYRKILSELREYIDVVERKMSAKKWGEINYETVPSKANLVYNNAFLKNDEERRREYLDKLEKGEAKINSSTNFPHDIVHSYLKGRSYYRSNIKEDKALEALWKALPDTVQGDGNTLVVRDGSGSMMCSVDGKPVVIWSTIDLKETYRNITWDVDGKEIAWRANEHCMVLIGYDKDNNTCIVSDPLQGIKEYPRDLFNQRYEELGKQAIVVEKGI